MTEEQPQFAWGHININVSSLDQSVEFYEKFGFERFMPGIPYLGLSASDETDVLAETVSEALGVPSTARGRACIMQLGSGFPKLDLTEFTIEKKTGRQKEPLENLDLGLVRICLASQDLRRDYARLKEEGVSFVSSPRTGHGGLADIAICSDPDGTLIELIQVYLEKWPRSPSSD